MWLPRFACPECAVVTGDEVSSAMVCSGCGSRFAHHNGCYRFLTASRLAAAEPLMRQYRLVRERDGYRVSGPNYYRRLPSVGADDPHRAQWALRCESFQHFQRHVLPRPGFITRRVLDVGAGNGWLSHRLASLGHDVVAVDRLDDEEDGLGACRHYDTPFPCVQADFDAPPFAPRQFDLIVFNGSLHYSPNVAATLARAHRLLALGGTLVVMDSPMFHRDADGHLMVADKLRRFKTEYALTEVVHPSVGFLTFASLADAVKSFGLRGQFIRSRGSLGWRARRLLGSIRLRRAAAAFGVWVAR